MEAHRYTQIVQISIILKSPFYYYKCFRVFSGIIGLQSATKHFAKNKKIK